MGTDNDGMFEIEEGADRSAAIHQALGYASMCWTEGPKGIFQSEFAHDAALKLERYLFPGEGVDVPETEFTHLGMATGTGLAPHGQEPIPLPTLDLAIPSHRAAQTLLDGGVVHGYEFAQDGADVANPLAMPVEPQVSEVSIDADPEFWHGLTMWGGGYDVTGKKDIGSAFQVRAGGHLAMSVDGHDFEIDRLQVIRLRDLLNVATARGAL